MLARNQTLEIAEPDYGNPHSTEITEQNTKIFIRENVNRCNPHFAEKKMLQHT